MAKILIAEDEKDIRELLAFTLRYAGYEVIVTQDGQEAYDMIQQNVPDLVLLDIRMPRMTGYEVCRRIKADEKTSNIPVVFLSAKGQDAEVQEGIDAGATEYLLKPFAPSELLVRVKDILKA